MLRARIVKKGCTFQRKFVFETVDEDWLSEKQSFVVDCTFGRGFL